MIISEVHIQIVDPKPESRLLAYVLFVIDHQFVVHGAKIINGNKGIFVAMPSREIKFRCDNCGVRNARISRYCNGCGCQFPIDPDFGRRDRYVDIVHPVHPDCRTMIQEAVKKAYFEELELLKTNPDHVSSYHSFGFEDDVEERHE
jgi:stage V sporulation protein G